MRLLKSFLFILILIPVCTIAQEKSNDDINTIVKKLMTNLRSGSREKIFLQTDKQVYGAGETIWFKAYLVDSLNNRLTNRSKTLFVDIVNEKDSIISQLLLHADRLRTDGAISLNASLPDGYYWLRAYTSEMINGNIDNILVHPLYILNPGNKNGSVNYSDHIEKGLSGMSDTSILLDIFPEGGSLISGTNSTVAVKAHDQEGNPLIVSGVVKDNKNNAIANFSTNNYGLDKFTFEPTWFGKYSLHIQNKDKYDSITVLPSVNPYAAQLSVTEQNAEYVKVRVMLEDSLFTNDYTTYIIGISRDSLCFAGVGSGMYELNVPVSNFPAGEANLLLFDGKQQLISEREIYINKKDYSINLSMDKENYGARENVKMNINVTDATGKPLVSALSLSVIDSRVADTTYKFQDDPLRNIAASDADLFMLTKSSRYKDWMNRTENTNSIPTSNSDNNLILTGIVINKKKEPVPDQAIVLMPKANNVSVLQDTTDNNGRFSFLLPDYEDSTEFNFQLNNLKGVNQDYNIIVDPLNLPRFTTPSFLKERYDEYKTQLIKRIETYHMDSVVITRGKGWLTPVTVKSQNAKEPARNRKNTSSNIITHDMIKQGGINNVGQAVMRSGKFHLLGGFLMSGGSNAFTPSVSDEPIVVMDGVQISLVATDGTGTNQIPDATETSPVLSFLKTINTNEVDYIRLLTGTEGGIYGVRSGHGVIEIHSSTTVNDEIEFAGLKTIRPQGFHVPPAFNMPDYNIKELRKTKEPDLRTTVYWNADIVTDNDGKATINFFTADDPATYIITIAGITINGDVIYKTVTVNRK